MGHAVNDTDGSRHTGIQAGNEIVKDHELDSKGSATAADGEVT